MKGIAKQPQDRRCATHVTQRARNKEQEAHLK